LGARAGEAGGCDCCLSKNLAVCLGVWEGKANARPAGSGSGVWEGVVDVED
jgi:hypothetical protein